jgi:hypothetical protein
MPRPRYCNLDTEEGRGRRGNAILAQRLTRRKRQDAEHPAIARPIITGELARDQRRIPSDSGEVRLSPLDGFLSPSRGIRGKKPAASGAKQSYHCQPGNRERDYHFEQSETAALQSSISAHPRRLSSR